MRSLLIFLFYLGALSLLAQQNQTVKDRMNYFSFLEGEWEGIGYYTRQNGWVDTVYQHELAEYKLNRTILTIEGTGKNKSGELVFNAFATLYFDNQIKIYEILEIKIDCYIHVTGSNYLTCCIRKREKKEKSSAIPYSL